MLTLGFLFFKKKENLKKLSSFVVFFNSQLKSSTWWIQLNS